MNAIPRWPYFAPSHEFLSVSSPQALSKPRRLQPKRKASTADGGQIVELTPTGHCKQTGRDVHAGLLRL